MTRICRNLLTSGLVLGHLPIALANTTSRGVPMLLAGDEVRHTQRGNNNAYCQDNEISWFDWQGPKKYPDLLRFWQRIIEFRKRHAAVRRNSFFTGDVNTRGVKDVTWPGTKLGSPGWTDGEAKALAFTLGGFDGEPDIHVMLNMHWNALDMEVPVITGRQWLRAVDTSLPSPADIAEPGTEAVCAVSSYRVNGRIIVVLVNRADIAAAKTIEPRVAEGYAGYGVKP